MGNKNDQTRNNSEKLILSEDIIMSKIYFIREQKVMLDSDLAELYGVETRQLKRQVRRNLHRFPNDFMFEISKKENESLRCQFGTLQSGSHAKYLPMVFTELGVAMLSSVLNSQTAIKVNIQIMRIFMKMRKLIDTHELILAKLDELEKKDIEHDDKLLIIFEYLKQFDEAEKTM
ncbi:MAG: ORF6N domain-containing protein, partial [Bacteroidales bacterium]|nr:ORF6N domain-containing protein [Bacteroidales bacterium]